MSKEDVQKQRTELAEKFPDGLFLLGLQVENVKKIKAVNLNFDAEGGLVVITGDNAQGKSSLLDAIWFGLGGAGTLPPNPIREGEKRAKTVLTIGDKSCPAFVITRNLWYGKRGELKQNIKVTPAELNSKPYDSPQTMLDALFELTSFDPLAFFNMKPSEQRTTLLQIAGLDDDLVTIKTELDAVFLERMLINRDVKQIEGELAGLSLPDGDTPDEEISITDLTHELAKVDQSMSDRIDAARNVTDLRNLKDVKTERVQELTTQLESVTNALADAQTTVDVLMQQIQDGDKEYESFPNLDASRASITEQITTAEATNEKVRAKAFHNVTSIRMTTKHTESNKKTDLLNEIEERKLKLLENATFPIEHIAVTGTGVMYQDLPLEQAAHSDQLRVSIALAIARHPNLRLIVSKEGDKLGKARRELLDEMAKASRHLVLIEKMSEDKSLGIYIEEGEVVREEKPATSQIE